MSSETAHLEPFAAAVRDEIWIGGRLTERRLSWGTASFDGETLVATDAADERLLERCNAAFDALAGRIPEDARVRLIAEATSDGVAAHAIIARGPLSVVTTPGRMERDLELLASLDASSGSSDVPVDGPFVWLNGSAAVLLHEAAGHPAEYGHRPLQWPRWLQVTDQGADLLRGDHPPRWRRASFRDLPMRRMSDLLVEQRGAPFDLPPRRVEILLVDSGRYEPLTEEVTVRVSAAVLRDGPAEVRLAPFEIRRPRQAVARALRGADGEAVRYPGVVCSREGQELIVGSSAPAVLTDFTDA